MAMMMKEEATFLVTLEVHPAAAHQEAVFLEEDLPAHYIGADAHKNEAEKKKNEAEE